MLSEEAARDRNTLTPVELVVAALEDVDAITDPMEKALAAGNLMQAARSAEERLRDIRVDSVGKLNAGGMGYGQIATALGVTKGRAQQLVTDWRSPKRPGVIEVQAQVDAAALRAAGRTDAEIAQEILPTIRERRGGEALTVEQIARAIGVKPVWLRPILAEYDASR